MIRFANLRFAEEESPLPPTATLEPPVGPGPQVFARAIVTPAGWPWDQFRAADLDARHNAPLPVGELMIQVRRLTPWQPRSSARFAALYVRSGAVGRRLETSVIVDGKVIRLAFEPPRTVTRRTQRTILVGVVVLASIALAGTSVSQALNRRADAEARLELLEQSVQTRLLRAEADRAAARDAEKLKAAKPGKRASDVVHDLAWTAAAMSPDAHFEAWHWDHGLVAVEVRGNAAPFVDPPRPVRRAETPIRRNVWLWGVGGEPEPKRLMGPHS